MTDLNLSESSIVNSLAHRYLVRNPRAAAKKLSELDHAEAAEILTSLEQEHLLPVWEALNPNMSTELLLRLEPAQRNEIALNADMGRLALLLSRADDATRETFLDSIDDAPAEELRDLISYPVDTAGRLMDTRILTFTGDQTVAAVSDILRQSHRGRGFVELKVVDDTGRLKSVVPLNEFALASPEQTLDQVAHGVPTFVSPMDPREEVVDRLGQYNLEELPVLDSNGVLLGVIRHAELIGALKESASVDIQTMVGASKEERATSSSWFAIRKRMPWLQINLLTAFMAAAVVGVFEDTIAKITALAVLLPVVAGQSGNAGSQALAVTMRGLALREIRIGQWKRVTLKEVKTGFWNGVAIAVTCGVGVYIWSGQAALVFVIAASMIIAMVSAGIAGALVPITLQKLGQDPAVASSIILTTVTDIAGFFSFLGIATLMMGMLR